MMLLFFELIGTVAFAASGAIEGIRKKMDVLGVCILGLTTAVGGGVLRDLILNITPPAAFQKPVYATTAFVVSLLLFARRTRSASYHAGVLYEKLLLVMDSIGLGIFTVVGLQVANTASVEANRFLAIFVGVLTGVGGGILRDMFAGNTPYIFIKHFYASASIIGAITCELLWPYIGEPIAMLIGAGSITLLRLLAAHYRWSLPKAE